MVELISEQLHLEHTAGGSVLDQDNSDVVQSHTGPYSSTWQMLHYLIIVMACH